jgi:hypothetical protein
MTKIFSLFALVLAVSACGSPNDPGVGNVTRAEADQLNEAAEKLNVNVPPPRVSDAPLPAAPQPPAD